GDGGAEQEAFQREGCIGWRLLGADAVLVKLSHYLGLQGRATVVRIARRLRQPHDQGAEQEQTRRFGDQMIVRRRVSGWKAREPCAMRSKCRMKLAPLQSAEGPLANEGYDDQQADDS